MTVKELKSKLKDFPDDMEVLHPKVPGSDDMREPEIIEGLAFDDEDAPDPDRRCLIIR